MELGADLPETHRQRLKPNRNAKLAVCIPQGQGRKIRNYIPEQELDQKL